MVKWRPDRSPRENKRLVQRFREVQTSDAWVHERHNVGAIGTNHAFPDGIHGGREPFQHGLAFTVCPPLVENHLDCCAQFQFLERLDDVAERLGKPGPRQSPFIGMSVKEDYRSIEALAEDA
jgi:hypothetical protein